MHARPRLATLATVLVTAGVVAGSSAAITTIRSELHGRAPKQTAVAREDIATTYTSETYTDVNGMTATVSFSRPSFPLVSFTAETDCLGADEGWCGVGIFADGVGELLPASNFAFDSPDRPDSWQGHAVDRSSNVLAPGTYTVRVMARVQDGATGFTLDDAHLTVQSVLSA